MSVTVADPGIPVVGGGGANLVWGEASAPEAVTFRKFYISTRKNVDP